MDVVRSILCCSPTESFKLLDAAKAGDAVVAASIIQQKPRLARKAQQWGGQTAWHIAARDGHADVLTAMADSIKATDLSVLRSMWGTDLGETTDDILESLVQYQDTKGLSPLHLACIKGKTAAVDVLMKLGANPFAMDSVGRTPLHYAASWGFADCINAVLGHHSGPPKEGWGYTWPNNGETRLVDVQNAAGFTPLHYAVWVGRKQAIQALASYDASLKVVNSGNDFEWIKVGSGNTPLHLAAFGGDMQVVKLLLAAYVQSLAAGAEVMTAGRGQWGNRHTDDVRHIRNRRGWMPYHIAIHKGYEHLAELLHPDIPYTFIFSNEDMAPGSVRMYGPARLMVIAAKALQQKLVDELAHVEAATTLDKPAAGAAVTVTAAAPAPDGDISELAGADQGIAAVAPAVIGAPVGSTTAAEPAPAAGGAAPSVVSPFAARSGRGWASFSAGASEPTSAATSVSAAVATPTVGSAVGTPAGSVTNPVTATAGAAPAAAAAAVAAATAAAAAVDVSPTGTDHTEHSFTAAGMQSQAAGTSRVAGLPMDGGSFAGFAVMQQQPQPSSSAAAAAAGSSDTVGWQQRGDNASVSDAGLSSSTIPASNAAVAGSAPGSISMGPVSRDSSMHKLQHGMPLVPTGQPVTLVEANSTTRSVQWAPMQGSSNAGSSQHLPAASAQQQQQGGKHRRVQSATGVYSRQGSRGLSDTAAGVRGSDDQQQSKFPWSRMESMMQRNSKKDFSEWLPPSAVQTSAEDDTDGHGNHNHPPNAATTSSRHSSQDNAASGSSQPLMRRISSLPIRIGSRVGPSAAAAAATTTAQPATGQAQWQPHRASFDVSLQHPVHENPLNVMLAARAQQIGDNPEAIRQQLLAMKLASGALQFDNAISTFTTSLNSPLETECARFASFSQNLPVSSRNSISSRPGVTGTVSPAAPAAAQQQTAAVVEAAAAAAATLPSVRSSDGGTSSSPFAAFAAPQEQQQAAPGDSLDTQQPQQQQASLSPSPSLFNITAANVIAQQPSQSLQRLLSGSSRGRRAGSTAPPQQQSAASSIPGVTSGEMGASLSTSPAAVAAGRGSANGELPIVQLQYTTAVAAMISEGSSGLDEDDLCEICFDAAAVVALQQCGHTLCVGCCKELCKLHHFKPGLCPYCRQIICGFERATHVFIP